MNADTEDQGNNVDNVRRSVDPPGLTSPPVPPSRGSSMTSPPYLEEINDTDRPSNPFERTSSTSSSKHHGVKAIAMSARPPPPRTSAVEPTMFYPVQATLVVAASPVEATLITTEDDEGIHHSSTGAVRGDVENNIQSSSLQVPGDSSSECPTEDNDENQGDPDNDSLPWWKGHKKHMIVGGVAITLGIVAAVVGAIVGSGDNGGTENQGGMETPTKPTEVATVPLAIIDDFDFSKACQWVDINIAFDDYSKETSWELQKVDETSDDDDVIILKTYKAPSGEKSYTGSMCLEEGEYHFVIRDDANDGICCREGEGYYNVTTHGKTLGYGDEFRAIEIKSFEIQDPACYELEVDIEFDNYSGETSWMVERLGTNGGYTQVMFHNANDGEQRYTKTFCMDKGHYAFTILDDAGDGICCGNHHDRKGSYSVALDGVLVASGGSFGHNKTTTFDVPDSRCHLVDVDIQFDDYSGEISYDIQRLSDQDSAASTVSDDIAVVVASFDAVDGLKSHSKSYCLMEGKYRYNIHDAAGDGLCCGKGNERQGHYNVTLDGETIIQGAEFGRSDSKVFDVGIATEAATAPSATSFATTMPNDT